MGLDTGSLFYVSTPQQVDTSNWISIAISGSSSFGIKSNGTLWAWGHGGRLGTGTNIDAMYPLQITTDNHWKQISCGSIFTLATKDNSSLYGWGSNTHGELGDNTTIDKNVPTLIQN